MTSPINANTTGPVTSIDGLVSGLNTTQIISQLMQLESRQQTVLQGKVTTQQARIGALQSLNTTLAAVQTAAEALTSSTSWQAVSATSSSTAVTATATSGAAPGSYTFDVTSLTKAHTLTVALPGAALAVPGSGFDVTIGGTSTHLNPGTDDADGVVNAVNSANLGVRATLVTTDQGSIVQLTATAAGSASTFTVSGLSTTPNVLVQGSDAQITVGNPQAGGYTVSSPTNSFSNLIPGISLTVSGLQSGVTVSVTPDAGSIADKMQALVTAANTALSQIGTQTAYGTGGGSNAPLAGTQSIRQIQQSLLSSVSSGSPTNGSYADIGVQLDSTGQLTFDREKFLGAYAADPTTTKDAVVSGLAAQIKAVTTSATDPVSGTITLAVQGANDSVRSLNTNIADWTVRLQARQTALQRQYSALEVALGKLRNQSSWLAGQLSGLSSGSTGSSTG